METITRLTKHQIIDETVDFYTNNPRAIIANGYGCTYVTEIGLLCAHSRCLIEEYRTQALGYASDVIDSFGDSVHQDPYRGHDAEFWLHIQGLHDNPDNWEKTDTGNTITDTGKAFVNNLKNKWKN